MKKKYVDILNEGKKTGKTVETISGSEFLTIFTVVIGFYFGTQRVAEDKNG